MRIRAGAGARQRATLTAGGGRLTSSLRFVRTIKESCLDRMIFFGEDSLRRAINQFAEHYHHERNHQGLGGRLIDLQDEIGAADGSVKCRERLGGLLRYYYLQAA